MAIVVSLLANDFDLLARRALGQAPLADLIELRLDRIGNPGERALRAFVAECPRPVIVSVPGPEGHGSFAGGVDERCAILASAWRAGVAFVEVDWSLSLELGEAEGRSLRIVSRHVPEDTPVDLERLDHDVRPVLYEGDLVKLVTYARSTDDGLRMLAYLCEAPEGLVAYCAGEAGRFTRILAPLFGSPFAYAAPGALPGEALGVSDGEPEEMPEEMQGAMQIDELQAGLARAARARIEIPEQRPVNVELLRAALRAEGLLP